MLPRAVCGPSGAGKSTLIKRLFDAFPGALGFSVSHTTRNPRVGEVDGVSSRAAARPGPRPALAPRSPLAGPPPGPFPQVDYHFTNVPDMEAAIERQEFIEHARVHANLYGTSKRAVRDVAEKGKVCILDIDVQGVSTILGQSFPAVYVFIRPPSVDELRRRLVSRGTDSEDAIELRLRNAVTELRAAEELAFDHTVVNEDLEVATDELLDIVRPLVAATVRRKMSLDAEA